MAKSTQIIELNGKRYDARTGSMLGGSRVGASLDGFVPVSGHALAQPASPKPAAALTPATAAASAITPTVRSVMDISRPAPAKLRHHAPKKSQTLMRSVVARPDKSLKRTAKTVAHSDAVIQQPNMQIVPKLSHPKIDPLRSRRAQHVPQSSYIHRFAASPARPVATPALTTAAAVPVAAAARPQPIGISPANGKPARPAAASMDVFERALQRANSHMELPPETIKVRGVRPARRPSRSRRVFAASAGVLAVIVLAGFIAFQNQANLSIKYASSKAGFAAALPAYQPSGYKAGRINYSTGLVGVKFVNNASGQSFALLQKQSSWDSSALLSNYVAVNNSSYKTIESAGRTIYTYGNGNATWVNGGVWYTVRGQGSLSTSELVDLATSM